jgi:putative RecB family exonuclease
MPRKPSLSPSKLSVFLRCPVKYRWTYLDPRGKYFMRAKSYYSFGSTLHRALQTFHEAGGAAEMNVEQVLGEYDKVWVDAGYTTDQQADEHRELGRQIIESYVAAQASEAPEGKLLYTEKQMRADLGPFVLIGRIDRVDEYQDGRLDIVDYKSGRAAARMEDVHGSLAMRCYQLLLRRAFPDRLVTATVMALRDGSSATTALTDTELTEFEVELIGLGEQVLGMDYDALRPRLVPECPRCDFVPLCTRDSDFKAAYEAEPDGGADGA